MNTFSKCVVCDDFGESYENFSFSCKKCFISVHQQCYGVVMRKGIGWTSEWLCSPCKSGIGSPVCSLCLTTGGAQKKTTCGNWCHVICALFTEGVNFVNKNRMEPINILSIPAINKNQPCIFCSKSVGICCMCSSAECQKYMHVTCAKKNNCLKEKNEINDKIAFLAYCNEHKPFDSSRRISSLFVRAHLDNCVASDVSESSVDVDVHEDEDDIDEGDLDGSDEHNVRDDEVDEGDVDEGDLDEDDLDGSDDQNVHDDDVEQTDFDDGDVSEGDVAFHTTYTIQTNNSGNGDDVNDTVNVGDATNGKMQHTSFQH